MTDGGATDADTQLLKAGVARIERDLERLDHKFDNFLVLHQAKHDSEQSQSTTHLLASNEAMGRSARHEAVLATMDTRMESVEVWRHELLGAMRLVKLAFGTSIISALATILGIVLAVTK